MPERELLKLQSEIDKEKIPDIKNVRKEHQLLADRNRNLILKFSRDLKKIVIGMVIILGLIIVFTAHYNDKASCERQAPLRKSLLALKRADESGTRARRKTAALEKGTEKAKITLQAAKESEEQGKLIDVKQLDCNRIFPAKK